MAILPVLGTVIDSLNRQHTYDLPRSVFHMGGDGLSSKGAEKSGLQYARNLLQYGLGRDYDMPEYYAQSMQQPYSADYYETQALDPMQRIDAPGYLSLGAYDEIETALRDVGQSALERQQMDTQQQLAANLGGQGLYGSSILGDAYADLGERFGRASGDIANQARLQRYNLEQADLANQNQFNLQRMREQMAQERGLFDAALADQQRMDLYNLGATEWDQARGQDLVDFRNKQIAGQFAYDQMLSDWERGIDRDLFNQAISLAGGGTAGRQVQAMQEGNQSPGIAGALGTLAGGYLSGALQEKSWNPLAWF